MKALASLWKWVAGWLSGKPHFVVGDPAAPYLLRWYILPRNPFFNVYLHKFVRDDEDRALHDHPWASLSVLMWGSYIEHTPSADPFFDGTDKRWYDTPSIIRRSAEYRHRIELLRDSEGKPIPAWTLFITGPRVREWGFWCEGVRFVHWRDFCLGDKPGEIGRGCGDNAP